MSDAPRRGREAWRARLRVAWAAADAVWAGSPTLLAGMVALSLVSGLVGPAIAWLQRDVLDKLAGSHAHAGFTAHEVLVLAVALGASGIVAAIIPQSQQYIQAQLRRASSVVVTDRTYRAVASWPGISRFESPDYADSLQLVSQLSQVTATSVVGSVVGAVQASITAVGFGVSLVLINPVLAAVIVGIESLAIAAGLINARSQAQLQVENSARARRQNSFALLMSDAVAAKEVRLFGLGGFLRGKMLAELKSANAAERVLGRRLLRIESGVAVLSAGAVAGGLIWVVERIAAGGLPVGDVSLFVLAAMGLQGGMSQIASSVGAVAQSVSLFTAYSDVVDAPPDLPVAAHPTPPLSHAITVEDVWFRYTESHPWVLCGLNMVIPAGSRTALVGINGAGKSTLIKLLCRFYDPVRGAIRWDGIDIREMDPVSLRQRIAGVFQDFVSYEMTAAENIGVGDLERIEDLHAIRRAAQLAGSDADIASLPDGYATLLSRVFRRVPKGTLGASFRPGVQLSGGQRQRLAVARAMMRADRDLLLVDEPMSSLDAEAEYAMNRSLDSAMTDGGTCVLISHRLASVRSADQIVVIADGVVVERGTHTELMGAGRQYARLFRLQASGYSDLDTLTQATPDAEVATR